jgi:glucose/mannose-6-phosphate isomerase
MNENAKVVAASDTFPASNHNDINAWGGDARAGDFRVVLLRDPKEHPRTSRRMELTKKLAFRPRAGTLTEVEAAGESPLARAVSAILVGDFSSVYLALKLGVDPTPVDVIMKLKGELAKV